MKPIVQSRPEKHSQDEYAQLCWREIRNIYQGRGKEHSEPTGWAMNVCLTVMMKSGGPAKTSSAWWSVTVIMFKTSGFIQHVTEASVGLQSG